MQSSRQHASVGSLAQQLERVRLSLKEYRNDRDILVKRLHATDTLIEQTLDEYERILEHIEAEQARVRASELAAMKKPSVDKLPNEVLMEIFKIVSTSTDKSSSKRYPVVLSHVCARWRAVSTNQSELWTTFGGHLHAAKQSANANLETLFNLYLERSGDLTMDLWFSVTDFGDMEARPTIIHKLLSLPTRIRRLAILFGSRAYNIDIFVRRMLKTNWPHLESLQIDLTWDAEDLRLRKSVKKVDRYSTFPKLKHLRSNADLLRCLPGHYLSQLTVIWMERCDGHVLRKYPWSHLLDLMRSSSLVELFIGRDLFDDLPQQAMPSKLAVKKLKHFLCNEATVARWMWMNFTFPELEYLALQSVDLGNLRYDPQSIEEYRTQQRVPTPLAPKLRTLAFKDCKYSTRPICTRFLSFATAPATHLIIDSQRYTQIDDLFEGLVFHDHQTWWPNLEILTYRGSSAQALRYPDNLITFLESQKTAKPLKLQLCTTEDIRAERAMLGNREGWKALHDTGRFEDIGWDDPGDIISSWHENVFSTCSPFDL